MNNTRALFVAATGQNVGKTTTCLGLISGLKKQFHSVGFLKPVGQEYVETETGVHVDKDVLLFKNYFHLPDAYQDMSPVLFPAGLTRDYLDGKVSTPALQHQITHAFQSISKNHKITIIEGTGHTGVGSIVDLNNAQVASLLHCPMLLVASGGLGSSFDELALNYAQCEKYKVPILGVILNRVLEEKREMIHHYMSKALKRWDIPLLGCIPYDPFLSTPTMFDFEQLFQTTLLTGSTAALRHFQQIRLVASPLEIYKGAILPNQLIITPASREEIILATLTRYWDMKITNPESDLCTGMILTGKIPPKQTIIDQIHKANIPMLYVPLSSSVTMKMIHSFTAKIGQRDTPKIEEAIKVVEDAIDFEQLLSTIAQMP